MLTLIAPTLKHIHTHTPPPNRDSTPPPPPAAWAPPPRPSAGTAATPWCVRVYKLRWILQGASVGQIDWGDMCVLCFCWTHLSVPIAPPAPNLIFPSPPPTPTNNHRHDRPAGSPSSPPVTRRPTISSPPAGSTPTCVCAVPCVAIICFAPLSIVYLSLYILPTIPPSSIDQSSHHPPPTQVWGQWVITSYDAAAGAYNTIPTERAVVAIAHLHLGTCGFLCMGIYYVDEVDRSID